MINAASININYEQARVDYLVKKSSNVHENRATFSEVLAQAEGAAKNDGGLGSGRAGRAQMVDKSSELYAQCQELETFFMKTLLKEMRKTVPESDLSDNSFAGKMYKDMLDDEYAKDLATNAGFGLADLAYLELSGQRGKVSIEV